MGPRASVPTGGASDWPLSSAHIPHIHGASETAIRRHWSVPVGGPERGPLPEYRLAVETICVAPQWMAQTMLLRYLSEAQARRGEELASLERQGEAGLQALVLRTIQKAYGVNADSAARQKDLVCDSTILDSFNAVIRELQDWKRPFFGLGLQILVEHEDDLTAIKTKLSEVCEHAAHCRQVKQKGFDLLFLHAMRLIHLMDTPPGFLAVGDVSSVTDSARTHVHRCFEFYMDEHKEKAFSSAFLEPARAYLTLAGVQWAADNADTHSANWWLGLLSSAIGVNLPFLPVLWDDFSRPVVSFWEGLHPAAAVAFAADRNFGKGWRGIRELQHEQVVMARLALGTFPEGNHLHGPASHFANEAVDPSDGKAPLRRTLVMYVSRFAHFFRRDFFVKTCFETLNSEFKTEYAGFRKACEALAAVFARERGLGYDGYAEFFYADEMCSEFEVGRCAEFFVWLGLLKPEADAVAVAEPEAGCGPDELAAAGVPASASFDLSERAQQLGLGYKAIFFIDSFTTLWSRAPAVHAQLRAEIFEAWHTFELESSPDTITAVAGLLLKDPRFSDCLRLMARSQRDSLRDCSGCVFRLHSLAKDGALQQVSAAEVQLLDAAIEAICAPFEALEDGSALVCKNGYHLAGLWMQALAPALCISLNRLPTATWQAEVRRLGNAIACWYARNPNPELHKTFKGHMQLDFMTMSHAVIWGRAQDDVVWRALVDGHVAASDGSVADGHVAASPQLNEDDVRSLQDMGFTEEAARKALEATQGSLESAVEMLLAQGPPQEPERERGAGGALPALEAPGTPAPPADGAAAEEALCPAGCGFVRTWHPSHCCAMCLSSGGRSHGSRCEGRRPICPLAAPGEVPAQQAELTDRDGKVAQLVDMGFDAAPARQALHQCSFDVEAALERLLQ